jgi:hypothetical protein
MVDCVSRELGGVVRLGDKLQPKVDIVMIVD